MQFIFVAMYLAMLLILLPQLRSIPPLLSACRPHLLLVLLALGSSLWSSDPGVSLRRAMALAMTTLFGLLLHLRCKPREIRETLAAVLSACAVLSAVLALGVRDLGLMDDGRGLVWRGVFVHNNSLGRMMTLGALACWFCLADGGRPRPWFAAGLASCLACVALSGSRTSWIMVALLAASFFAFRALQRQGPKMALFSALSMIAAASVGAWLFEANKEEAFSLLGRDPSLTGRVLLWNFVLQQITEHPVRGFGFGTFWSSMLGDELAPMQAPHAHNGFLELWLELGGIGAALFLWSFIGAMRRSIERARAEKSVESLWPAMFLLFTLLSNITESSILAWNTIFWALYIETSLPPSPRPGGEG